MRLNDPITTVKGIGPVSGRAFAGINVNTVGDLIALYPRTYLSYKPISPIIDIRENYLYAVCGRVATVPKVSRNGSRDILIVKLADETGSIILRWFNMPYLANRFKKGSVHVIYGKVKLNGINYSIDQGEYFTPVEYDRRLTTLKSVYPLTSGLTNNLVTKTINQILEDPEIRSELGEELFNESIIQRYSLMKRLDAVIGIHTPTDMNALKRARGSLVFEEFLLFLLSFRYRKEITTRAHNTHISTLDTYPDKLINSLPYELTSAQKNVWSEISRDMNGEFLMNRLVQGDVGSGKTIVAVLAMLKAAENNGQSAIMVPTEVLAHQHYNNITAMLSSAGIPVTAVLLTGSLRAEDRRAALEAIRTGEAKIIIGTHALFQDKVEYKNLVLSIIDEQHRFGVVQRKALNNKGSTHVLVMSATPIPRTLALIIYGDMDISVMNVMPQNRLLIKNCVVDSSFRPAAYKFLRKQVEEGHQCYVICPMVEESENMDGEDVISYSRKLNDIMPDNIKVSYLHGKMKGEEKDSVMKAFADGKIHILVSTTVIEVGVDVRNATVMMIENAERFGLSALHQLRGRVGRGNCQSYCIFVNGSDNNKENKRLSILASSNDGFYIANEDLKLRGPGDILGVRQSGEFDFKIGDIYIDASELKTASEACDSLLKSDPLLEKEENAKLKEALLKNMNKVTL